MQDMILEVFYFLFAGGWGGILALLLGIAAGIFGVRGMRRDKKSQITLAFVLSILALFVSIIGMMIGHSTVDAYVKAQAEQGVDLKVVEVVKELGGLEASVSLYWGLFGLMPGLFIWLARNRKPTPQV
jgi:hypothetical protein